MWSRKVEVKNSLIKREFEEEIENQEFRVHKYKEMEDYLHDYGEQKNEYLVNGAILTCDRATCEKQTIMEYDFECTENIKDDMKEAHKEAVQSIKKRTYLTVLGCDNSDNDDQMATVKAHEVIDVDEGEPGNILPFHCNCMYGPNNEAEKKKLLNNIEKYQNEGTCGAFMCLENDWENMITSTSYFRYMHTYGNGDEEEADGITMASALFCSHGGGFIIPIMSGQSDGRMMDVQKFVNIALEQARKGVKEEIVNGIGTNNVIYNDWFYNRSVSSPDGESYAWCAVFVSWCADQAGILCDQVPFECACVKVKEFYVNEGRYHEAGNYEPKVGDVFVHLKGNGTGHVGIVAAYDVDAKKIYTIEGNSNNQVLIRERDYDTNYFDGFGSNGGIGYGTIPDEFETGGANDR